MSWFESSSIASFAKNAIKEAQKTIDKALDIKQEQNMELPYNKNTKSQETEKSLKLESENFFEAFGLSGSGKDSDANKSGTKRKSDEQVSSSSKSPKEEDNSKMAGSIWGSFSGSFFDNDKITTESKDQTISATMSHSESEIIAKQPPRSTSSLPVADYDCLVGENFSSSSSISGDGITPSSCDFQQHLDDGSKSTGWEGGLDSSIMLMSSDLPSEDASRLEENVDKVVFDKDGFAHSHLMVGDPDEDEGDTQQKTLHLAPSNEGLSKPDHRLSSFEEEPGLALGSPESIIVLDSYTTSVETDYSTRSDLDGSCSANQIPSLALSTLSLPNSIVVIDSATNLHSESSVEILNPSSEVSDQLNTQEVDEEDEETWGGKQDDAALSTITKQPLSYVVVPSKLKYGNRPEDSVENFADLSPSEIPFSSFGLGISEEGSMSESVHSGSTSSTHTIIDGPLYPTQPMDMSEISDRSDEGPRELAIGDASDNDEPRMNAGDIRKKLDDVGGMEIERPMKMLKQSVTLPNREVDIPIGKSYDESLKSSHDAQHMTWMKVSFEDIGSLQSRGEESILQEGKNDLKGREVPDEESEEEQRALMRVPDEETKEEQRARGPHFAAEREHSPTSSDRSEAPKVSSGHSSADEMETTTSSDIEVISSLSGNGSNGNSCHSLCVTSGVALKVGGARQKDLKSLVGGKSNSSPSTSSGSNHKKDGENTVHEKVENFPSSMTTSFTSVSESEGDSSQLPHSELLQLEASRITQVFLQDINLWEKGHRRNQSMQSETSESSVEPHTPELEKLCKKIIQLTDVIEARETKVLELSHANASLMDSNQNFKSRIAELEKLKLGTEATEMVREEFTQRLATMERKFQQSLKKEESLTKQIEEYRVEVSGRRSNSDVRRELDEKDATIVELRHEGEKLSKQQLNYSNIIKKLRSKEKESDACIADQKEKIESQGNDLERMHRQLSAKEEVERRQIEAIRNFTTSNQRLEIENRDLKAENAELEGKLASLKEALDSAYREMAELKRITATKDAVAQEQAITAEVEARQKVEAALEDASKQSRRDQEILLAQIHELQEALKQSDDLANRKERLLKSEISNLQQRLTEAEVHSSELSNTVSLATRPLLRQMENLQNSHSAQQAASEALEESLTKRLNETQSLVAQHARKEREAKEQCSSAQTTVSSLQLQVASLAAENSDLSSKLEIATANSLKLETEKSKENVQMDALKKCFSEEVKELRREKDIIEQQLEIEKLALTSEKKKVTALHEQLKEKDRKMSQMQLVAAAESRHSSPHSSPTHSLSVTGSFNESLTGSHWGDEVFDPAWPSTRGGSVYTLRGNSAATVDVLTSTLRQREGELHHLQSEIIRQEAQKESLAQELVETSWKIEEMKNQVKEFDALHEQYKDTEQKYNALLQMYGEKVEEVDELKLDLVDIKEMYRVQIDHLTTQK